MIAKNRVSLGISNVRLVLLLAVIVTAGAVVLWWPMQQHVTLNFVLEPEQVKWVRGGVGGEFDWLVQTEIEGETLVLRENELAARQLADGRQYEYQPLVRQGAAVTEGALVAGLKNPRLEFELIQISGQIIQVRVELAEARKRGLTSRADGLREREQMLQKERKRLQEMIAQAQVKTPMAGEVLSTRQELDMVRGRSIPRGAALFLLADTSRLTAKVWVSEKTLARIFPSADRRRAGRGTSAGTQEPVLSAESDARVHPQAELMLYAFGSETFTGRVAGPPSDRREDSLGEFGEKLALSNKVGGEVLTEYDPIRQRERPVEAVYEMTIELDDPAALPSARPYMSGRVRIDCGKSTLYQWGRDSLLRFIAPEVRL